jgi:hypothetical protein
VESVGKVRFEEGEGCIYEHRFIISCKLAFCYRMSRHTTSFEIFEIFDDATQADGPISSHDVESSREPRN